MRVPIQGIGLILMNSPAPRIPIVGLKFPLLLLATAMVCALFLRIGIMSWHNTHRLYQGLALLGVLSLVLIPQAREGVAHLLMRCHLMGQGLGLIFILGLASASLALYPGWALQEVLLYALSVLVLLLVANVRLYAGIRFDTFVLLSVGGFIGIYAWYVGLPLLIELLSGRGVRAYHLMQGFDNPRFLGQFQTLTLPLLAALAVGVAGPRRLIPLWLGLMAFWWMLSFATGTRATWLALGVASLLALGFGRSGWRILLSLALTAIVGFALYWLAFVANAGAPGSAPDTGLLARMDNIVGLSGRDNLWSLALVMWEAHPLLGVGPMHFAAYSADVSQHPHNATLQWLAEWGTPAACLMMGLIIYGLIGLFKFAKRCLSPLAIGLWMALLAAMVQAQVDGVFVMPNTQMWMVLIGGWALGMTAPISVPEPTPASMKYWALGLSALSAGCVIAYVSLTLPQISEIHQREAQHLKTHPGLMRPRFWRQGYIGSTDQRPVLEISSRLTAKP